MTEPHNQTILTEDPITGALLSEIYDALKSKSTKLSISENCWLESIDSIRSDNQERIDNQIEWYIKVGNDLMSKKQDLNPNEVALLDSLKKVMVISSESSAFSSFFAELEESAESLFRLDYSKKTEVHDEDSSGEIDLLKYTAMTLNMAADKFRYSVLSNKAVNVILNSNSGVGVIVTDLKGEIRFISNFIEKLAGEENSLFVGRDISQLISDTIDETSSRKQYGINLLSSNRHAEPKKVNLQKILASNEGGEVDEYIYLISEGKPKPIISYKSRLKNINEIIDSVEEGIDSKSVVQVGQLKLLRENLSRLSEYQIEADSEFGMGESFNVEDAIESKINEIKGEADYKSIVFKLDLSDDLEYMGIQDVFHGILDSSIRASLKNFASKRSSGAISVVASNLHNCLILVVMDTGNKHYSTHHGSAALTKINQFANSIGGTAKVESQFNSGSRLTMILPF
jgi:hypothetical protein